MSGHAQASPTQFDALAALFASIVALLSAATLLVLRLGLDMPWKLVVLSVSIPALASGAHALLATRQVPGGLPPRVTACIAAFLVLLSPIAAHVVGAWLFFVYPLAAIACLAALWARHRPNQPRAVWGVLGLGAVTALYLFWSVNNQGIANLYAPEQMAVGLLNRDTTFHTAVAHMILTQGYASLGMDGALPLKYHVLSHYWFAALARMANTEPVFAYMTGVSVVLVPMLAFGLFAAAQAHAARPLPFLRTGALVLALLFVSDWLGWSLYVGASRMDAYSWSSYYISESYTMALAGLLLVLPLLLFRSREAPATPAARAISLAIAVIAIPILTALKISVGFLWALAWAYAALRRDGLRLGGVGEALGIGIAMVLALVWLMPGTTEYLPADQRFIVPLYLLRTYPEIATLAGLVLPLCYVVLVLRRARVSGTTLREVLRSRRLLAAEILALVTVAGFAPGMLGIPQDSAVWYFMNVGQWFALPLLIAEVDLPALSAVAPAGDWALLCLLLGGFIVLQRLDMVARPHFLQLGADVIRAIDKRSAGKLLNGRSPGTYVRQSLKREGRLFGTDFSAQLQRSPGAAVQRMVAVNKLSAPGAAVFVPRSNAEFWNLTPTCYTRFHLFPAISGVPLLLGAPPDCPDQPYTRNYGASASPRDLGDDDLCAHARDRSIERVYVLADMGNATRNRLLECKRP
jgi:hypothetical protein